MRSPRLLHSTIEEEEEELAELRQSLFYGAPIVVHDSRRESELCLSAVVRVVHVHELDGDREVQSVLGIVKCAAV